ncbi:flagellar protein FliT [uncultured Paenibacillus sp.]|uniref:flagellar protein FliT n=2 Tax=Paenibacillus TaxID=44249 RepID=UPI000FDC7135|nr:flagellar protein FliT [uncultured Paenibacillus sp.]
MPMDRSECISQLESTTNDILNNLYDLNYEQLESFIELRQQIVDQLIEHFSQEQASKHEKEIINNLLDQDHEILARMNTLRLEAQDWLHKRGQAKVQRNAYEAGYTPDSFLMDRKK